MNARQTPSAHVARRTSSRTLSALAATVGALHLLGWGLFFYFASRAGNLAYAGAGTLAYTLGLRHAFDADHISAIDDSVRLLVQRGKRPLSVGLYFSLGHATVVFALSLAVAFGAQLIGDRVALLRAVGSVVGASVSGGFLYLVAGLNAAVLYQLVRAPQGTGAPTGLMSRIFGQRLRLIRAERQLYWVGLLFGLGFDTASEIGLLGLTASAATHRGLPPAAILALPLIFAAGMSLFDTADGVFMVRAYAWAQHEPVRKRRYNVATTALSVAVAFGVGTVELLGVLVHALNARGGWVTLLDALANRFELLGLGIVVLFGAIWLTAALVLKRQARAPPLSSAA